MSFDLSSLSSDPLLYFLAHSTVLVVLTAAIFFTFGLAFGWFTWARYKSQRRELLSECGLLKDEIVSLKRKLAEQMVRASASAEASHHADAQSQNAASAATILPRAETAPPDIPESQPANHAGQGGTNEAGVDPARPFARPESPAPDGSARLISDPHLGLIYASRPALSDDLGDLKGMARLIEGRLHELGVYTFKQIGLWNDENIREFSSLLAFKDRIHREQWVEQARELHFQKYGERL